MKLRLAVWLLTILARTWRISVTPSLPAGPAVIAFWHGSMLPVWWACQRQQATAMVSLSKDGTYLAAILEHWGYTLARGSSSQGGSAALATLADAAQKGTVLITPDGPRGPRHIAKAGAVVAAARSGASLIPIRVEIHSAYIFKRSWDLFELPLPWSKVNVYVGTPLVIPGNASHEHIDTITTTLQRELGMVHERSEGQE